MKTDLFQSCGHGWVFQICWHIECTFTASSFRIWNSLVGIPSPPLALLIVMLPKAHLTLHYHKRLTQTCLWVSRSLQGSVGPILLLPSVSLHWSLKKAFLSLLGILLKSALGRWATYRRYPTSKVRSSGCFLLDQPWRDTYPMSKVRSGVCASLDWSWGDNPRPGSEKPQ